MSPAKEEDTVFGTDDSNNAYSYDVTLTQVVQQAVLGPYETPTNGADHVAAAEFTVTGKTGNASDDANSDAQAIGSDTQVYTASFDSVTVGTNFSSGEFNVSPGQTETGWVSFELPPGATVASVKWSAGFGSAAATWTVSK